MGNKLCRHLLLCLLLLPAAGCQPFIGLPGPLQQPAEVDGPPLRPHGDLSQLPDPTPRDEPKSARGNPPTYEVFGKRYRVMASAVGYVEDGNASWYGRKFHGRTTSSGEPFDMFTLTAAHRSLPIPTYVRVTRRDTGAQVVVRVNDRGPFHSDRIIDLSYAAAVKLGFHQQGTAPVRVEVISEQLEPAPQVARHVAPPQPVVGQVSDQVSGQATVQHRPAVYLQAGAFSTLQSADRLVLSLQSALDGMQAAPGIQAYVVQIAADALYRVRIGPVPGLDVAQRIQGLLAQANFAQPVILP